MSHPVTILGIDPGSRVTGYGVITAGGSRLSYVTSGCIRTGGSDLAGRLEEIYRGVSELVAGQRPEEVAVERVFVHRNADSALKLGHARAAAICGTFGDGVRLFEYAAREVKQAVTGTGGAAKEQVQMMVRHLLALEGAVQADAADALAVAICHAHMRTLRNMTRASLAGGGPRR